MARESTTPLCFRLNAQDRRLVATVAAYQKQTLSDYVRELVLEHSAAVINRVGRDEIMRSLEESTSQLHEQRRELYEQGINQASARGC